MDFLIQSFGEKFEYKICRRPECKLSRELVYVWMGVLLCAGFVLSLVIFVDYRYKEQSEHIIKQQEKAIDNLSKALKSTSETHSKIEKSTRDTLSSPGEKIGKKGKREYSVQGSEETLTQ